MSLYQSQWPKGRKQIPVSGEARGVVVERFKFTINDDLAIGDIIEIGGLPAYHFPVDAVLVIGDALDAGATLDVGLMSGDYGDDDDSRTSGAELLSGAAADSAGATRASAASAFGVDPSDNHRGIGAKVGGAAVTASGQEVTLVLQYAQ